MISGMSDNIEATFSHAWAKMDEVESILVVRGSPGLPHDKIKYVQFPSFVNKIRILKSFLQFICSFVLSLTKRPDLICTVHMVPQGYYGFLISKLTKIPLGLHLVNELQGGLNIVPHYKSGFGGLFGLFGGFALKAARKACFITTTGNRSKQRLIHRGIKGSKIYEAPSIIDTTRFHPLNKEKIYDVVTLARLSDVKRLDIFLRVIHEISKTKSIRTAIAGTGSEKAKLERLVDELGITDCVEFLGWVNNKDLNEFYNSTTVFMLTSATEGFPTTIAESLCAGTCCVSADVGDISTILNHGVNGFLVSPFDAIEKYVHHILSLLEDSDLVTRIVQSGLKAREVFSFNDRERIYREILSNFEIKNGS